MVLRLLECHSSRSLFEMASCFCCLLAISSIYAQRTRLPPVSPVIAATVLGMAFLSSYLECFSDSCFQIIPWRLWPIMTACYQLFFLNIYFKKLKYFLIVHVWGVPCTEVRKQLSRVDSLLPLWIQNLEHKAWATCAFNCSATSLALNICSL